MFEKVVYSPRQRYSLAGASILAVAGALTASPLAALETDQPSFARGRLLVHAKAGLPSAELDKLLRANGLKRRLHKRSASGGSDGLENLAIDVVDVPINAERKLLKKLRKNRLLKFVELDWAVAPAAVPNDPQFTKAWHLSKLNATTAWDYSTGQGVVVAVLDTGVDGAHPDLASKLVSGWNVVSDNGDTADVGGHGTAVAGSVAASTNNGLGISAIGSNASIMPVRITNNSTGYAYLSDIAKGLTWAADHGAKVANISYAVANSSTVSNAAAYFRGKGGIVFNSAGNSGASSGETDDPNLVTVGSTNSSDAKSSFSNYGNFVDLSAPGEVILTTTRGGGYANWSGTSFSSPIAAGVASLVMAANPRLTNTDVELVLERSATDLAGSDYHSYFGWGRVDALAAVTLASKTTSGDSTRPTAAIFSPSAGSRVQGNVSVDVNASDDKAVAQVELYAGGKLVGVDTSSPYQFTWSTSTFAEGSVALVAKAYDTSNNVGQSPEIKVTVDNIPDRSGDTTPPTVTISSPANGMKVSGTIAVNSTATDNIGVAFQTLYVDGRAKVKVTGTQLVYGWSTSRLSSGPHTLKVIATDKSGNVSEQSLVVYR